MSPRNISAKGFAKSTTADTSRQRVLDDVACLLDALGLDKTGVPDGSTSRAVLVALCGLPGTGKTHFAKELTKTVPMVVLESDRLRKILVTQPKYSPGEHSRVFNACHQLIEGSLSRGCKVLFDATNFTENFRRPLYQICHRLSVPLVLVQFTAPRDAVRRRLEERAAGLHPGNYSDANWLVYCRLAPYEEPVQRQHFTVDSTGDISSVLEDVVRLTADN